MQKKMAQGYALSIGLNVVDPAHYGGWNGKLTAPEKDAADITALAKAAGFSTDIVLRDKATRKNVISAIENAATNLRAGDIFLFYYSGHGGQLPDLDGDEDDGKDETLCLYDGQLLDDELKLLWGKFNEDVRIFMLSDSCHSGSVAKEVYNLIARSDETAIKAIPPEIAQAAYNANRTFYDNLIFSVNQAKSAFSVNDIKANVRLISGCQDNQSSYDGPFNSAFTQKLMVVWNGGKFSRNYSEFHLAIQALLPPIQSPNHLVFGKPNPIYDAQIPFTISARKESPAAKNNFLVDLSAVELSDDQVLSIDSAIQKAISSELLNLGTKDKIQLIPIGRTKSGGFDRGFTMGYRGGMEGGGVF
jgi:hypothetical protein